jgi:hypothetical protein
MKSAELVALAANELNVSTYEIGKRLGYGSSRIYEIKSGRKPLPEKDVFKVCEWIDLDPITVLPDLLAERSTKPESKKVWKRIATLVKQSGATAAAVVLAVSLTLTPAPAQASFNIMQTNNIHYAQLCRFARRRYISIKKQIIAILGHFLLIPLSSNNKNN